MSESNLMTPSALLMDRTASKASSTTLLPDMDDPGEDDPDMIVLGFQELDLSAGALLYSTETTREEAWYTAAMAGLGEKAEMYTKVSVPRCASAQSIAQRTRMYS